MGGGGGGGGGDGDLLVSIEAMQALPSTFFHIYFVLTPF